MRGDILHPQAHQIVQRHAEATRSRNALRVLARWEELVPSFVKVMPHDYRRMLAAIRSAADAGLDGEAALAAAFEANARDLARVGGG